MIAPQIKSQMLEQQRAYILEKAKQRVGEAATETEVSQLADEMLHRYYNHIGHPLFQARKVVYGELPFIEDYYENNQEMEKDLEILFAELNIIATYLVDYYNYSNSEKESILTSIRDLNSSVSDLQMLSEEATANTIFIKESFMNYDSVDYDLSETGNQAMLHTEEGILTLRRTGSVNHSLKSKVKHIQGNGSAGTYHLVRRIQSDSEYDNYAYVSSQTPNDEPNVVIDGSVDSVFEYQMVNVSDDFKKENKYYDFEWANGKQNGNALRLRIVIKLDKEQDINWINVKPYHSPNSPGTFNVYSIRTSLDGFEYVGLMNKEDYIINQSINSTPQSYRLEDLFDGSEDFNESKFAGQGLWSFPSRKARYVEFVFDQPISYKELLGQERFFKRKEGGNWIQIPRQEIPAQYVDKEYGVQKIKNEELKKELAVVEGWRYSLGIAEIQIMSFQFTKQSEYISKLYSVKDGISKVSLYVNEKVPTEYKESVSETNDFIQYFVSFNDIDWHRISPAHHQPVTDNFPPKIISINTNETDLDEVIQLHKSNINLNETPNQIRLKIVLKRPDDKDFTNTTPIVEDYAIKIQTEKKGV